MNQFGSRENGRKGARVILLGALTAVLVVGLAAAVVASTVVRKATEFDVAEQGSAAQEGGQPTYRAENPTNDLRLSFSAAGLSATPKGTGTPAWRLDLGLPEVAIDGQPGSRTKVQILAAANRIDYDSGAVKQSFVNTEAGVEQTIRIAAPSGGRPGAGWEEKAPTNVTLDLAVAGGLSPSHVEGYFVDLVTSSGDAVLRWGSLRVTDANGTALPARLEVRSPGEESGTGGVRVVIDAIDPAYPIEVRAAFKSAEPAAPTPTPEPGDGAGEIVGVPVTLGMGITETVEQIMERQRLVPPVMLARPRETHSEFEADLELGEDPNAPALLAPPSVPWTAETQALLVGPPALPQTVGTNFLAVNITDAPYIPPDSMGAVGPTQVLVHTNGRIRTFTKAGAADGALNSDDVTFWTSVAPGGISDPEVRYDRLSGRWFLLGITVAEATGNKIVIAVSSGSTIASQASFTFYSFVPDATRFCDYPSLGVDANALYTGCNLFSGGGTFQRTSAHVVRKTSILSGGPIVVTTFGNIAVYAPRGVDNDDPAATEGWVIGTDTGFTNRVNIRRVSTPGGTPTLGTTTTLAVSDTNMSNQQASGSTTAIDVSDIRLFMASIHKNKLSGVTSLWTAHSVEETAACAASSTASTDRRIGARWYEIAVPASPTAPTITQQGNLCTTASSGTTDNVKRGFMYPTVALTGQGHLGLGTSFASSTEFAGVAAAGRLRTDASGGTRAPETIVQSGLAAYTLNDTGGRNRWGDYSFTQVDPTDDQTLWTFQEYADLTSSCPYASCWSLRAVQLKAPAPPALSSATAVCTGRSSTTSTVTGTDSCTAPTCTNGLCTGGGTCPEFFDPIPPSTSDSVGWANHISATVPAGVGTVIPWPTTNIVVPGSPSSNRVLQMTLALNTTGATAGTYTITVKNPDGQAVTSASAILTVNQTPTATPSNNGPICAGATLNLSATTVAGATYSWTGPNGFSSSLQNPSIANATAAASGVYTLTVTANGCVSTAANTTATVTGTGGACGSQTSTTCDAPDTCGAAGVCQQNLAVSGTSCGVAGSACKNQDTCNGTGSCIDNGFKSAATLCTGASQGGACDNDAADHCSGTSSACVDIFQASGFTCRSSAGQCDVAETCTGTSGACPADGFASSATLCTGASQGGACDNDAADHCSGTSNSCVDIFRAAGITCRASAGQCDVAETCTGTSGACPTDGFQPAGTACGDPSSGSCDNADTCDGSGSCQSNNVADGTFCGDAGTSCTNQDTCSSGACQDNGFQPAGTACGNPSSGSCDNADTCDGAGSCQSNNVADGVFCGDAGTSCTNQDTCLSGACHDNGFQPAGTACGDPSNGSCDNADTCDGSGSCQSNNVADGTFCGDAGTSCTNQDTCSSGACQDNGFQPAGTACGDPSSGSCDNADTCDGAGSCQSNNVADGTFCGDAGTSCTNQDTCSSGACQDNGFQPAGTACGNPSSGSCDNADTCDGAGSCQSNNVADGVFCGDAGTSCTNQDTCLAGACHDNGFHPAGTACGNPSSGSCDNADTCDGAGSCQSNNVADGTFCGDAGTSCTNQDTCSSGACQDNGFQPAGTACGNPSSGSCDNADTCDGAGLCSANNVANGTFCGDAGTSCTNQDTCLSGACHDNGFQPVGTACGNPSSGSCDNADTCDGSGLCQANNVADGTFCGDAGTSCTNQDTCLSGACHDNGFQPAGTACGNPSSGSCDNADTCDGAGSCQSNNVADGTFCGDAGTSCTNQDRCSSGACQDNGFQPAGTACGNPSSGSCDFADTCNGFGGCLLNHVADGTACDDANTCTGGDVCASGTCAGALIVPAAVNDSVRFNTAGTMITWTDPPGNYSVYRGSRTDGIPWAYNQTCHDSHIPGSSATDLDNPPTGSIFYYLITRVDACAESSLGNDSSGSPRPNLAPCP